MAGDDPRRLARELAVHSGWRKMVNINPKLIPETRDLGFMLYDLNFSDPENITPVFFRAEFFQGVVMVPRGEVMGSSNDYLSAVWLLFKRCMVIITARRRNLLKTSPPLDGV